MILDLSKEPHSRGMMGSPGFVAPEVILGQHHTSQMDCYSLGVLLFVMLVGAKPMTQDQARSMQYALMTPESLRGMHVRRWLLVFVWLRACGCFQLSVWCPMQYALVTPESVRGMHKRSCLPSLLAAGVGLCCLPCLLARMSWLPPSCACLLQTCSAAAAALEPVLCSLASPLQRSRQTSCKASRGAKDAPKAAAAALST